MKKIHRFLFWEFFKIALFVIGGGLAMLPVIEDVFSKKHKLLTKEDILDMIALTQTVPGLIAINSAVFVGRKLGGIRGSICAVVGVICPSLLIIMLIAWLFPLLNLTNENILMTFDCVRAAVVAMFVITILKLKKSVLRSSFDVCVVSILFLGALAGINSVYLILTALGIALIQAFSKHSVKREIEAS